MPKRVVTEVVEAFRPWPYGLTVEPYRYEHVEIIKRKYVRRCLSLTAQLSKVKYGEGQRANRAQ